MSLRRIQPASDRVERSPRVDETESSEQWSSGDCLRILRRHLPTMLGITCLGLAAAAVLFSRQSTGRGRFLKWKD
jgi:hypothetical protein